MNVAPSILTTMLDSRTKDLLCAVEFYLYSEVPDANHGFKPDLAVARFATETTTFSYLATSASYFREALAMPSLNRIIGKQSNSVTINFSNISKRLASFVLNNEVEGMRVVLRVLSRAHLSNPSVSPAQRSFVAFVGKCQKPEGFNRKQGSITAKQDLGQIEAQIPPRVFQKPCPLEFGGTECLGTELLTDKNAAFQSAFASFGRRGCNKTFTACTTFGNTAFFQGTRIVQIEGSFIHRPHEGFMAKLIGLLTPGSGKRRMRVGNSVEDGTPYGKAIPAVLGRALLTGIPLQFQDIGTSINFLIAWCRGPIASILNFRTNSTSFTQPLGVTHHYGRYGGESDQLADTVFPEHGFFSRLAYSTGFVNGSDIATEEAAPDTSSVIAGASVGIMATAHLMNRCGSGRVSGAGMSYAPIVGGSWTDNPVDLCRLVLTDPGLLALDESFIEVRRSAISSFYCNGAIRDDSNAERLLLPNTENGRAGVDYKRYNSTGLITSGCWPLATRQFPVSRVDHEAKYEYFDPSAPPAPGDIEVQTFYRKRFTANAALTDQKKVIDFLYDTLLPTFRGFLSWNNKGQIAIRCERPADSTPLRVGATAGSSTIEVLDAVPWIEDINETGFGNQLIGKILIGVGLTSTSEVRRVTSADYNPTIGNAITLDASATGGTTATPSGATLTGGTSSLQSHGSIQIGGTLTEGDTVTAIIDGIEATYTLQADNADSGPIDAGASVASALAFAINAHPVLSKYIEADNSDWEDVLDIYSKVGTLTLSSELEEDHDADEETIRVMMSFAGKALAHADTTKANVLDGSFKYLGGNGQTRYNQFKGTYHDPLRDFAEQPLIINDEVHQESNETKKLEIDLSAVDNYNQAWRLLNGANAKFGDGTDFFSWGSNGLALQLEEGDVICISDDSGEFRNVPVRIEQLSWNSKFEVSFTGRIYSTSMFDDTVQATEITLPSGLINYMEAPPAPTAATSVQTATFGINGTYDTKITGTITVGDSVYGQKVNIYVTPPGGTEALAQTNLLPDSSGVVHYEIVAPKAGLYTIRAQSYSLLGIPGGDVTTTITVGNLTQTISVPTSFAAAVNENIVTYTWQPPATNPERVTGYILYQADGSTVVMDKANVLTFSETFTRSTSGSVTRKLKAVDSMGNVSTLVSVTFSLTATQLAGPGTVHALVFEFDGAGSAITTAIDPAVIPRIPWNCKILSWTVVEITGTAGTITIDLQQDTYANFPPTGADSITGTGTKPGIASSGVKATGSTFTNWASVPPILTKDDQLYAVVTAAATVKHIVLELQVEET